MKGGWHLGIKKLDTPLVISDGSLVRLKEMGNITEVMHSAI